MSSIPRGQTPERRAYMKAYTASHPQRDRRAYKVAYDAAHKAEDAAYRAANREKLKLQKAANYRANRDQRLAAMKTYVEANRDRIMAYHARYEATHREQVRAWTATTGGRRRARKAGNGGSHTLAERLEKFAGLGNVCFYCRETKKLSVDHDVPIARGGTDNIDNILPACLSCNRRKSKRTADEFIATIDNL